ncbi:hypothetical protein [Jeotgalibacillus aurantiacus]|uniref:hypothetical protein n=1 Tax=Jeotgalibacillus aurantiacus TaxID=2763266 RepID=UPI001D0B3B96|nr:hypothetical protein [Jeotgalibacillus aurantiacus]
MLADFAECGVCFLLEARAAVDSFLVGIDRIGLCIDVLFLAFDSKAVASHIFSCFRDTNDILALANTRNFTAFNRFANPIDISKAAYAFDRPTDPINEKDPIHKPDQVFSITKLFY